MSDHTTLSRHQSYNNRFRTSSSDSDKPASTTVTIPHLNSLSEGVDELGQSSGHQKQPDQSSQPQRRSSSQEAPQSCSNIPAPTRQMSSGGVPNTADGVQNNRNKDVPVPAAPGKPRRLSRQISAGTKRQFFAGSRSVSGADNNTTSVDSTGEVFLDVGDLKAASQHDPYDSSLFASQKRVEKSMSVTSTASIMPNPYNHLNHRLHSVLWCCSCLYFVFFCCLPAVHYMEKCDVEFKQDNQRKASRTGRVATLLFFVGFLLTLLFFTLIFFLAVYFTTR